MLPGFQPIFANVSSGARIFSYYRSGKDSSSDRPLLIILHGWPQNNMMWKDFVKHLPDEWSVFIPDLPGYGQSFKVDSEGGCGGFSKRAMAKDILEAADTVHNTSNGKVIAFGHDRGARVCYRMALDSPERVVGLSVLDIVPGIWQWHLMNPETNHSETKIYWHWVFLSSPRPLPETLIGNDPLWFTKCFFQPFIRDGVAADWVNDILEPLSNPERSKNIVSTMCEDYRAGATLDVEHDREQGIDPSKPPKKIYDIPVLVLSSAHIRKRLPVDDIWTGLAGKEKTQSYQVGDIHWFPNTHAEDTANKTVAWLDQYWPRK